jgi:hypothetical protein
MVFRFLLTTLALVGSITATNAFCPAPAFYSSREVAGQQPGTTALQVAIDTSEIKTGMTVELDGEPFQILNFSIMKQARGAAKTTIKFRNMFRGTTIEMTFRSGERFAETAEITKRDHQFTYSDEVSFILHILSNVLPRVPPSSAWFSPLVDKPVLLKREKGEKYKWEFVCVRF